MQKVLTCLLIVYPLPCSVAHRQRLAPQVLLIDVRTQEEIEVSGIPGAIHAPAVANASAVRGWWVQALRGRGGLRAQATAEVCISGICCRLSALQQHWHITARPNNANKDFAAVL